ncbi:MAG: cysteine desulfurase [Desulfurococcaceae archaeon]|jgi:cysteine desulfurase/selenocysteine lyase|nr:cysteine desulfurase [Desulfurococcaceae archaeon]
MFDPYEIRKDFPILSRLIRGRRLIYLDNAATTQKPKQVVAAIARYYLWHNANVHRGLHTLSQEASQMYEEAHEAVAKFINARSWDEVVFTYNVTEALNLVAYTWGLRNVGEGDKIVLTVMEHHSNMLPWRNLARLKGARVVYADITDGGELTYEEFERLIDERTKVVAVTLMSNVLGTITADVVKRVAKLAHEVGAIVVADGAQYVPHAPTNVRDLGVDFLGFSGHKMLGPMGIGVLWGRREILEELEPFKSGGDTIKDVTLSDVVWHDLPWRFEAGTPNVAGAVGLKAAIEYLTRLGMDAVREHEKRLVEYTLKRFSEELGDAVEVYGPKDPEVRGGVIAFNVKGLNHHTVGMALDMFGIAVRTGMHCAHPLHYRLGLRGTVRASYYVYNIKEEVDELVKALKTIILLKDKLEGEGVDERVCTGT